MATPTDPQPPELETGALTFLFTDIEGSTSRWESLPEAMSTALARHDEILRAAVERNRGRVVKSTGDGLYAVFGRAGEAVVAALEGQLALGSEDWQQIDGLRVRMGIHSGESEAREGDYFGHSLNRAARVMAAGHGGQVLLSGAAAGLSDGSLPETGSLRDLGRHRLPGLTQPEQIFQLLHSGLATEFPPLRSLDAHPNNLPVQVTSFVGRERELARMQELLDTSRLLTLTGSGGTGKTRLSIEAAGTMLDRFPDGIWFVELAPLVEAALVPQALAEAMGLHEEPGQPVTTLLTNVLGAKRALVVLDNCEHLVDACARLADTLARACPHVHVLATSRAALTIAGETTWRVPPLELADPSDLPDLDQMTQYESVRLFIDRACAAKPAFAVTNQNAPAVAQICQRLDGIPLAIELAAARVKVLAPEQIAERLDDRFRLLTGGSRTALPRQQTLRALVDWGYELLTETERALLRRLSVFAGGWTLEAAEQVCAGEPISEYEVLDLLSYLVDKSLVVADEQPDGSVRYRLLETLREYGAERLQELGEAEAVAAAHRRYFTELAESLDDSLYRSEQLSALARMEAEHDNFRAILAGYGSGAESPEAVRLAAPLALFSYYRNYWAEAKAWLDRLAPEDCPPTLASVRSLAMNGWFTAVSGDRAGAEERFRQAEQHAAEVGTPLAVAWPLGWAGVTWCSLNDAAAAAETTERSLEAAQASAFDWGIAVVGITRGWTAMLQGDVPRAVAELEPALANSRVVGDRMAIGFSLSLLGTAATASGDLDRAVDYLAEAVGELREVRNHSQLGFALKFWGQAMLAKGDVADAAARFSEGLDHGVGLGKKTDIAGHLSGLGCIAAATGRPEEAARLLGAVTALRETSGIRPTALEQSLEARAAETLGEEYEPFRHEGLRMPLSAAVALAQTVALATAPQ